MSDNIVPIKEPLSLIELIEQYVDTTVGDLSEGEAILQVKVILMDLELVREQIKHEHLLDTEYHYIEE